MSEASKMHNGWPTYFSSGHAIQRCDATTGHTVSNVAFCDTPERASELAKAYIRADIAEQMAEALRACQSALAMMIAPDAIQSTSVLHAFTQATEAECKARAALSAWEASNDQ